MKRNIPIVCILIVSLLSVSAWADESATKEECVVKCHEAAAMITSKGLDAAIKEVGGIDLRTLIAEALHMGDEGHNRNKAGSLLYLKALAPGIAKVCSDSHVESDILKFLGDNALSVLNPVMAACKAMCDAAHNIEGSTVVSAMARNGTDFGIRISGLGDRWFTAPAPPVDGLYFPGFTADARVEVFLLL